MRISQATVSTESADSYMRKLGQHWSHRFSVAFDPGKSCTIEMGQAKCELFAHPDHLDIRIELQPDADQSRLETVVEEHIKRFAFREQLHFAWERTEAELATASR
jgi:uncharacterized protein